MSVSDTTALFVEGMRIQNMNEMMNIAVMSQGYYTAQLAGGSYNETVVLADSKLPDGKSGLRNGFAQQLLHQQMVDSQYNLNEGE